MFDHYFNTEGDALFTLYFKQKDVTVHLSRQELVNLIKESVDLLELSGGKRYLFEKESRIYNFAI